MIPCEPKSVEKPPFPIMEDYNMTFTAYAWIFEEFYKILPYDHKAQCMEDIMTTTGAIDAMAEEVIKTRQHESAKSPPLTVGSFIGIPVGSEVGEGGSDVTMDPCGTSSTTPEMTGGRGKNGKISVTGGIASDEHGRKNPLSPSQQRKNGVGKSSGGGGNGPDVRARLGPPPKLPPKPPGLLEKVKELGSAPQIKQKPPVLPKGKGQKNQTKSNSQEPLIHHKVVKTTVSNSHCKSSFTDTGVSGDIADDGKHSGRTSPKSNMETKPPLPAARNPVAATRSLAGPMDHTKLHDGIQRTISSPLAVPSKIAISTSQIDSETQHSTEDSQKPPKVMSRVHDIQDNLMQTSTEVPGITKKLSVLDHHIKVREKAAVFEKIVQGISEKTSIVSLDIDAAGGRKRSARKPDVPLSPTPSITSRSGNNLMEKEGMDTVSRSVLSKSESMPVTAPSLPIPRPRSDRTSSEESNKDSNETSIQGTVNRPIPHPRRSLHQSATAEPLLAAETLNSDSANADDIYDEVCEFAHTYDVTATLAHSENKPAICVTKQSEEPESIENIYEDTLLPDTYMESIPRLPPDPPSPGPTPSSNTCRDPLIPLLPERGPLMWSAAAKEMAVTDESGSRDRGSIYEVCLPEDDQSDDRTASVADTTTTENQVTTLQEMPAHTPGDPITPSKDEEEGASLGTHKISRQRRTRIAIRRPSAKEESHLADRQQRVAVKMRSAEGSGVIQRRNGELKRQGRSLQDLNRVREEEKAQKEKDEEETEKIGLYDVTQLDPSAEHYMTLYDDQGSDGNEYEEVPTLSSSDEEQVKGDTILDLETASVSEQLQEHKEEDTDKVKEVGDVEYAQLEEERRDSVDAFPDTNIRDRAKTSPESVRAAGRQNLKKRYSEGAFEDFVPLFFKKDAPKDASADGGNTKESSPRSRSQGSVSDAVRPKSVGTEVMEDIRLIRAELDRRNARRLNDEKEEAEKTARLESQDQADDDADYDSYQYVTEANFDNENMSSDDSSDYEKVTGEPSPSAKHGHSSGASYDLEEHRRTLSREGSQASGSGTTSDYLMLFEDWKEVEGNGLMARRNKGSNEKKERRRVFPTDSSASDADMTQSTTQGSLDIQDMSDTQMSDENGVYRSFDAPASPEPSPSGHKMLKQGGISLPGLEVTPPKLTPPEEAPPLPPPPPGKKSAEKAILPLSPSGLSRKPSRFVVKEPLFQIYQADLRVRDSKVVLRPRTARKKPPLPARSYLPNRNLPPPLPPHHPQAPKPSLPTVPPPPLPARNNSNISTISNVSNITNRSVASTTSSNISQHVLSTEIRTSLQKELFSKLNSSDTSKIENFTPINNNIRSGDSHKIMDNSRTCSGNSVPENGNDLSEMSQMDEMEDPTYMSGNDEGSSSMYSCEEESLGEMDRNRTHGSSMETRSSQQSAEGEDPIYQGGMEDPIYQPGMEDEIYQSGLGDPTYGGGENEDDDGYDEFDDDFDDDDYYTPPSRDGPIREGSVVLRSYWCELPEVVSSGLLPNLTAEEKKMQEALFEIITSEASYLKSLNLVVNHFVEAPTLLPPQGVLKRPEHHSLFSNIKTVRDISERLLLDLEQHQQESILLVDVCRILHNHLKDQRFEQGFVTYCANNQYQVKMLHQFRNNPIVMNEIRELEASPECCSLDLLSFLMLPFQRITRLPLLLEAVISRAPEGSDMMVNAVDAFTAVRKMAEKCNEEAKRMEMIEEVTILARLLEFKQGVKKMDISQSSTIVKRGMLDSIVYQANILGGKKKPTTKRVYCIVFTDKVLLAKEKSKGDQTRFDVIDWCPRNLVQVSVVDQPSMCSKLVDGVPPDCHCIFTLNLLQNNQRKTNEFILNAKSLSERQRWMDALCPPTQTEDGERIYESWDCPQVICMTNYEAKDRDELTLELSDRVDVYKKIDGWYEGQLVGSRERGWFPASCVQEVVNDHVRARILKKRHKILSMCEEQIRLALANPKVK